MRVVLDTSVLVAAAFAAQFRYIVMHNVSDFRGSEQLGIAAVAPGDFLNRIRSKA